MDASQSFLCNHSICGPPVLYVTVGCNTQARADHSIPCPTAFRWKGAELTAHAFLSGLDPKQKQVGDGRGRPTCQLDIQSRTEDWTGGIMRPDTMQYPRAHSVPPQSCFSGAHHNNSLVVMGGQ